MLGIIEVTPVGFLVLGVTVGLILQAILPRRQRYSFLLGFIIVFILDDVMMTTPTTLWPDSVFQSPISLNLTDLQTFILFGVTIIGLGIGIYKTYIQIHFEKLYNRVETLEKEVARLEGILDAGLHIKGGGYFVKDETQQNSKKKKVKAPDQKTDESP